MLTYVAKAVFKNKNTVGVLKLIQMAWLGTTPEQVTFELTIKQELASPGPTGRAHLPCLKTAGRLVWLERSELGDEEQVRPWSQWAGEQ